MNRIYYFSSTGNTLAAAREFAAKLGDTELLSIADLDRAEEVDLSGADTVGIFFPVYCFGLPGIVQKFISRIVKGSGKYVYSLCTCGGMKGSAAYILEALLKERGIKLAISFSLTMPSNYIPRSIPPTQNRMEKLFAKASRDIVYAVRAVKKRKTEELLHVFPFDVFGDAVAQKAVAFLSNYDRYFWVTDKCDACGLCEKICPDSNIIMMNGIPTWHGHSVPQDHGETQTLPPSRHYGRRHDPEDLPLRRRRHHEQRLNPNHYDAHEHTRVPRQARFR
jgi:ferredoxin